MIVPLHNHSQYSALDGLSTTEEIALRCVEIGCSCCGLTDHGVVTGHLDFAKTLTKHGIKPIFGCELYHGVVHEPKKNKAGRDQAHLIALAKTDQGLKNLWSLISTTADEEHFHNVQRAYWEDLEKYKDGLIITSACISGLVPQGLLNGDTEPLNRYLDIYGDNFWIEISTYPGEEQELVNGLLIQYARERGIGMVYANDAHYAFPSQFKVHDMYIAIQASHKGDTVYTPVEERSMYHPPEAVSMMDEATVREHLSYLPQDVVDECINNSVAIAESITATLPEVRRHLPMFVPGDCPWLNEDQQSLSTEEVFVDLVSDGIVNRYGEDAPEAVWDRALYEMETLVHDDIHHYFLMGWDEVQFIKSDGFDIGPGRGSSAGCITAYALGITDIDPLDYDLIFERFWNSGRAKGFPDIDTDFPRIKRAAMLTYLKKRWGEDRVFPIGTTAFMKPKSVIDKLAKGFGISFDEAKEIKEIVGKTTKIEILGHKQIGWSRELEPGKVHYVEEDCGPEIDEWIFANENRAEVRLDFINMCKVCCSRVRQYGIHASGVVIADESLMGLVPLSWRGKDKEKQPVTAFTMDDIDALMLIKLDVLGLRNLDSLEYWRVAMENKGIDVKWTGLEKEEHPAEMWQMIHDGYTAGIFQIEDGYGAQLCKNMKPDCLNDLGVIVALNRPGPIQAKIPDRYVERKFGREAVTYDSPAQERVLDPILDYTYGLFVYQEQIIFYFNALGYSKSESDAVRKILGKKQPQDLEALRDGTGAWDGRGYFHMANEVGLSEKDAEDIWNILEGFADYCFNKSHAMTYGVLLLRTMFAKYYDAAEFYAACMRSFDSSDRKKKSEMVPRYVSEARRQSIEVKIPDIEMSLGHSHVDEDGTWWLGFEDVMKVGSSGEYIVEIRDWDEIDISTPETFELSFEAMSKDFLKDRTARKKAGEVVEVTKSPKMQLQSQKIQSLYEVGAWQRIAPDGRTMTAQQEKEVELLGVILTDNSTEVIERNQKKIKACDSFEEAAEPWWILDEDIEFTEHTICGIVSNVTEKKGRASGKTFGIVTIEDPYSDKQIEFTVFSNRWKPNKFLFHLRTVGIFTIRHSLPNEYGENFTFEKGIKLS
jgi:DNA polymerase-3 subunit alpha